MRRGLLALILAASALAFFVGTAGAHALLASSNASDGEGLDAAPQEVAIRFTEPPDPRLSTIAVLDVQGTSWTAGNSEVVPSDTATMRVPLRALPEGVYTVTWRVVSRVDGHLTSGAFAFGVGVEPAPIASGGGEVPPAPFIGTVGRWALYLGLSLLLGVSLMVSYGFREPLTFHRRVLPLSLAGAFAGLYAVAEGQRVVTDLGLLEFLSTSTGRGILARASGLVVAGLGVAMFLKIPQRLRAASVVVIAGVAMSALAHAAGGHAGAGSWIWLKVGVQWVHILAAGAWIGGLAALLMGARGLSLEEAEAAALRFSRVAATSIFLVAATGVIRAVGEVGSFSSLTGTGYGRIVIAKSGILATLGVLGWVNRYRAIPSLSQRPSLLRRVGVVELLVAVGAFVASGFLAQGVPPAYLEEQSDRGPILAEATDFARSVRANLEVRPGTPGPNSFVVRIFDFDSGEPADAELVRLTFEFDGERDVGPSTLDLERSAPGVWRGEGLALSVQGSWRVTALIQQVATSRELVFDIETRLPEVRIDRVPGQPTLFTVSLAQGRSLQVYADPERVGFSQFHATYFTAEGEEEVVGDVVIIATDPAGVSHELEPRPFSPGHFIADVDLTEGTWRFEVEATTGSGEVLVATVEIEVPG